MSNADKRRKLTGELNELRAREKILIESFPPELSCCEADCFEDADWVRSTQFGGDHPYRDMHAMQEEDFGQENPSYFFWLPVSEFLERVEHWRKQEEEESAKFLEQLFRKK